MIYSNYQSDIETIPNCDYSNNEDFISTDSIADTKFEEIFTKIFSENNVVDLGPDNEVDNFVIQSQNLNCNAKNSQGKEGETVEQSKVKINKDKEDNFNELSSIICQDKSTLFGQNLIRIECLDENLRISKSDLKLEETCEKADSFLGKKRNLFKIDYPKNYSIFQCGEFNKTARHLINDVYREISQNDSQENEEGPISKSGNKKNWHKKILNVEKRKENADNIRKKIKSRFLKVLRNTVNEKLKLANSKKFFKNLPQIFISNVSREKNKPVLNLSFKDLFSKNFCEEEKTKESDLLNFYHNISVFEYLEQNYEISEKSNFNNYKNMTLYQIYNEYLKSKEFEMEIASLKKEKESEKYIKNYIIKACSLMQFFTD